MSKRQGNKPPTVHPSMSPKGVEHNVDFSTPPFKGACIHQCRRKALSTLKPLPPLLLKCSVHPSMSPKGVEHVTHIPGVQALWRASSASINVAERR